MTAGENPVVSMEKSLQAAQLEKLQLENEKLRGELAAGQKAKPWYTKFSQVIPVITTLLAICGFLWGIFQYSDQQTKNRLSAERQSLRQQETAEREFMQPWLDNQRETYLKALAAASVLANSADPAKLLQAQDDFWQLYHGRMIMVETKTVSAAMVSFGACFTGTVTCTRGELNTRLHDLAKRMEESMAATAKMTFQEFIDNQFQYNSGP